VLLLPLLVLPWATAGNAAIIAVTALVVVVLLL
jgi:hypothetical protein